MIGKKLVLLVDETKLSDHLSVMLVGLAYQHRCIPLVWRCYTNATYPAEGQVKVIQALLNCVRAGLPSGSRPVVEVYRGIGTSSKLIRVVEGLGWGYLFQVHGSVRLRIRDGKSIALVQLVKPGESWQGWGQVFKKAGWLPSGICVHWDVGQAQPWCLLTNGHVAARHYAIRVWQEEGFRDLKSGGWQGQRSQVWQPAHAERLLLVLALAYAWILTQGTWLVHAATDLQRQILDPDLTRYSIFVWACVLFAANWLFFIPFIRGRFSPRTNFVC